MRRHVAPAADPFSVRDLWHGLSAVRHPIPARTRLASDIATAFGVEQVFPTSSGRAALTMALRALRRRSDRSVVILPAYTCFTVAAAAVRDGLRVRLCDIVLETMDFDYGQLALALEPADVLCVVSTHLLGCRADTPRTQALCAPLGTFVIDDAAQAFGVLTDEGALGTLGDLGIYSFSRGKLVSGVQGGAVVTRSADLAEALRAEEASLDDPGWHTTIMVLVQAVALWLFLDPRRYWIPASLPFLGLGETVYDTMFPMQRMPGIAAGLLVDWPRRLARGTDARMANVTAVRGRSALPLTTRHAPVRLPVICASQAARDRLLETSDRRRLGLSRMYPTSLPHVPQLATLDPTASYPGADALAGRLVTVPVHPLVSHEDRDAIVALLQSADDSGQVP